MMRRLSSCFGILLLASPLVGMAAEWEQDLDAWSSLEQAVQEDIQMQDREAQWNSDEALFPEDGQTSSQSLLDELRDERTGQFITIRVGTEQVVLRDVPRTEWFAPYVRDIAERQLVSGYADVYGRPTGLFGPADSVTLEQLAKVLVLGSGMQLDSCPAAPQNTSASGSWSAPYIACAEQAQWTIFTDSTLDVSRPATRTEVVVSVLQSHQVYAGARTGTFFQDVTASTQFAGFIERAKLDGIVSGYADAQGVPTGIFGPDESVTRAEFAKIVTLATQVYAR